MIDWARFLEPLASLELIGWQRFLWPLASLEAVCWSRSLKAIGWPRLLRALFWCIICLRLIKFLIRTFRSFLQFFTVDDLLWPRDHFFWKVDAKSVILIYKFPTLRKIWNLTQNDPKFEIWHQTGNFSSRFFLLSHWSFWAIIWLNLTNLWFLI